MWVNDSFNDLFERSVSHLVNESTVERRVKILVGEELSTYNNLTTRQEKTHHLKIPRRKNEDTSTAKEKGFCGTKTTQTQNASLDFFFFFFYNDTVVDAQIFKIF